jgi:FtsH-binding integral membrane protein
MKAMAIIGAILAVLCAICGVVFFLMSLAVTAPDDTRDVVIAATLLGPAAVLGLLSALVWGVAEIRDLLKKKE